MCLRDFLIKTHLPFKIATKNNILLEKILFLMTEKRQTMQLNIKVDINCYYW